MTKKLDRAFRATYRKKIPGPCIHKWISTSFLPDMYKRCTECQKIEYIDPVKQMEYEEKERKRKNAQEYYKKYGHPCSKYAGDPIQNFLYIEKGNILAPAIPYDKPKKSKKVKR